MSRSIIARVHNASERTERTAGLDQIGPVWHGGEDDPFLELQAARRLGKKASIGTRQKLSNSHTKKKVSLAPVPWKG